MRTAFAIGMNAAAARTRRPMVLCAWCGAVKEQGDGDRKRASHGICDSCVNEHLAEIAEEERAEEAACTS